MEKFNELLKALNWEQRSVLNVELIFFFLWKVGTAFVGVNLIDVTLVTFIALLNFDWRFGYLFHFFGNKALEIEG